MDIHNPCLICQSWLTITWGKLRKSLRDARQKSVKRGTSTGRVTFPPFEFGRTRALSLEAVGDAGVRATGAEAVRMEG